MPVSPSPTGKSGYLPAHQQPHAAALFDLNANLQTVREDVGRYNAVDKVIGHALLNQELPLSDSILLLGDR
ncbi:MAG: formate dehydrogenase accessory sulfurtransferase FdhD [Pseudomonadales bacterium]|nr:formate dehydrogenase accessory sulfurtransferase FdhD [Pseudomonadales bacterium]